MKLKIKEWEIVAGIKLLNLKGFKGKRSKIINNLYSENQFKKFAKLCNIKYNRKRIKIYILK